MQLEKANEESVQITALDWVRLQHPWLMDYVIHIKNERKTSLARGARFKRMGVRKGVSDLFICWPNSMYHGLFIEIKRIGGRPTKEQIQFIEMVNKAGYYGVIAYGIEKIIDTIHWYLKIA